MVFYVTNDAISLNLSVDGVKNNSINLNLAIIGIALKLAILAMAFVTNDAITLNLSIDAIVLKMNIKAKVFNSEIVQ